MLLQIVYKLKIMVDPHTEFIFPSQDQEHQFSSEAVEREMKVNVSPSKLVRFCWDGFCLDAASSFPIILIQGTEKAVLEHILYFSCCVAPFSASFQDTWVQNVLRCVSDLQGRNGIRLTCEMVIIPNRVIGHKVQALTFQCACKMHN